MDEEDEGFGVVVGDFDVVHGLTTDLVVAKCVGSFGFELGDSGARLFFHGGDFMGHNEGATSETGGGDGGKAGDGQAGGDAEAQGRQRVGHEGWRKWVSIRLCQDQKVDGGGGLWSRIMGF